MTNQRQSKAEARRLEEDARRHKNWKRWGPYLAERQWGTVREDYSTDQNVWDYFPHRVAPYRAYRWGEDGLLGICDREGRLCFAVALWNEQDPILKERLFGLTNSEGNHGEDVKECYFYLVSSPTHSYLKALYKYPQRAYPYQPLVEENRKRDRNQPEYELLHTGIFDDNRYFDVMAEYAKQSPNDLLIRLTVDNRGPDDATLHILPTLWFRNTWAWGRSGEGYWPRPTIERISDTACRAEHASLGRFHLEVEPGASPPVLLFTDNETNGEVVYHLPNETAYCKDALHALVVHGRKEAINPNQSGTKVAAHWQLKVPGGGQHILRLRLYSEEEAPARPFGAEFEKTFAARIRETEEFFVDRLPPQLDEEERRIALQAYAGLLWSKQFYHYDVRAWLEGDPAYPPPPPSRKRGRNWDWQHLYNRDVISMPDKWEYPWYAAWDLAFHMLPMARIDPAFAKEQLILFLREWYMHPNGQIPAYEFAFSDVNPPVHAWAAWRVYKIAAMNGKRDRQFLARVFQKLLINFTWWVNRKDIGGNNLFSGGFLGLDNIGPFDRSKPLPTGVQLEQADGTAWMAFYCATMLSMALELAKEEPAYDDLASKFFEHFVAIVDAMNTLGGSGLWSETDGFYYDQLSMDGKAFPLRLRSFVGLIPIFAVELLESNVIERSPHFKKRMRWFLENRADLARHVSFLEEARHPGHAHYLLAIPSRDRLARVLRYALDEQEFLSPFGLRSLSRVYQEKPFVFQAPQASFRVAYAPGESDTGLFGGNSNWRGPVWFPLNYLFIEALERYHHFYQDSFRIECPTGSGNLVSLKEVARELVRRLVRLFLPDSRGMRPCHGGEMRYAQDPRWRELLLFHEYFHAETGEGLGASHQTGWTALVARCLEDLARSRQSR